jgi:hypothetical protein
MQEVVGFVIQLPSFLSRGVTELDRKAHHTYYMILLAPRDATQLPASRGVTVSCNMWGGPSDPAPQLPWVATLAAHAAWNWEHCKTGT